VAVQSKVCMVVYRLDTETVGSKSARDMDVCYLLALFCLVLSCAGRSLEMCRSPNKRFQPKRLKVFIVSEVSFE